MATITTIQDLLTFNGSAQRVTVALTQNDHRLIAEAPAMLHLLKFSIAALSEAEAILGGEYGDKYTVFCDLMMNLRTDHSALIARIDGEA